MREIGCADVGDFAVREPVVLHRREIHAGQRLQHLERPRPLHGEQRVARAGVDRDRVAGRFDVLGDVRVVAGDVRGVDDEQEVLVGEPVDEQVVDERARGVSRPEYCACPTASFEASLQEMRCTASSAFFPAISISPMWLTSNIPARSRTARCSTPMPEYSTGMSQPPNGTILAPKARWRAWSGVFFRGPAAACSMGSVAG